VAGFELGGRHTEGNGVIRFNGIYSYIDWYLADTENYGVFTVGFDAIAPAANALRATSAIVAPSAYVSELASNTRSVSYNGFTSTNYGVKVGYASGYASYWGDGSVMYEHWNSGATYGLDLRWGWQPAWVDWFNDKASSIYLGPETHQVTLFEHNWWNGESQTFDRSDGDFGDDRIRHDRVSSYLVYGNRYEDFKDYGYNWTSKWNPMYDQRVQLSYGVSTQSQDIYDYRPVYKTSIQKVKVENMRSVTVWKDQPVYATQVELVTEVRYDAVTGRVAGAADSITGRNITIDAGGDITLSGKMTATNAMTLSSLGQFTLRGLPKVVDGVSSPIQATLSANQFTVSAGTGLLIDDTAWLKPTQAAGQVAPVAALSAGKLLIAGGTIGAETGTSFATVALQSQRSIELSGLVVAGAISVTAGSGTSGDGGVSGDSQTDLRATSGNIGMQAGQYGGSIDFVKASLTASAAISLSAPAGRVVQSKIQGIDTKGTSSTLDDVTVEVISGLIKAPQISVLAETAIALQTEIAAYITLK
jgi:hypothetical protein